MINPFRNEDIMLKQNTFLKEIKIHESWGLFLNNESIINLLACIEKSIIGEFTPSKDLALRFLELNLNNIKMIILGQDPYPQAGAATGRAFEVGGLNDWCDNFKQSSLRNILKNIYASYNLCGSTSLNEIRKKITDGSFKLPPPDKIFDYWESQGVLCLNTAFTCVIDNPGSHTDIWQPFSDKLIEFIAWNNKNIIWFLWGKEAQKKEVLSSGAKTYKCNHPMLAGKREQGFLNCRCFIETKNIIDWI